MVVVVSESTPAQTRKDKINTLGHRDLYIPFRISKPLLNTMVASRDNVN